MKRDNHRHWLPGWSANPGGRIGVPAVIKTKLRELSPRAVERLADSADERVRLVTIKVILDDILSAYLWNSVIVGFEKPIAVNR